MVGAHVLGMAEQITADKFIHLFVPAFVENILGKSDEINNHQE